MTHNEKVASYKAYFQTGDPQFIPSVYEKTAHVNEVQAWKDRWTSSAGYEKEARGGHPAHVALARRLLRKELTRVPKPTYEVARVRKQQRPNNRKAVAVCPLYYVS